MELRAELGMNQSYTVLSSKANTFPEKLHILLSSVIKLSQHQKAFPLDYTALIQNAALPHQKK
jgi:hypothetical protein